MSLTRVLRLFSTKPQSVAERKLGQPLIDYLRDALVIQASGKSRLRQKYHASANFFLSDLEECKTPDRLKEISDHPELVQIRESLCASPRLKR